MDTPKARASPQPQTSRDMPPCPVGLIENFREAVNGLGTFCPVKNELRIRKARKSYRITCREYELGFNAPGQQEVVFVVATDATAGELKRGIAWMIAAAGGKTNPTSTSPTKLATTSAACPTT